MKNVLRMLAENIQPAPGHRSWHGGPTPLGALRGVTAEQAYWAPAPGRKNIWALTLHIAYWTYAIRRRLDGEQLPRFPRGPANWPTVHEIPSERAWRADVELLRQERERLLDAVTKVPMTRLGTKPAGAKEWTYGQLILGIAQHDAYHTGQIQLLKRLWEGGGKGKR